MNPEFERNLWLELTPRRVVQMVVVLGLIFLTVNVADPLGRVDMASEYLFFAIVVIWGTREAAQSVVEEIRDRTWDSQRLSALTPFEMTWGKLLGATSYVWLGGAICLAVMIGAQGPHASMFNVLTDVITGLLAQSAALFASLLAVRRRQSITRFNVFQYQALGIIAASGILETWRNTSLLAGFGASELQWWNMSFDGRYFFLVSNAVLLIWVFVACYRLMRLELQMRNWPVVWTAFVLFVAIYAAGFGRLPDSVNIAVSESETAMRLLIATLVLLVLTYAAVLHEPKDRVLYRWLAEMFAKRSWGAVFSQLQCWMIAYAATLIAGAMLVLRLQTMDVHSEAHEQLKPLVFAALGFLTRDLGIILFFALAPGQKRGDLPAIVTLGVLYGLAPQLLRAFGVDNPSLFFPTWQGGGLLGAVFAWAEAIAIWTILFLRSSRAELRPQPVLK